MPTSAAGNNGGTEASVAVRVGDTAHICGNEWQVQARCVWRELDHGRTSLAAKRRQTTQRSFQRLGDSTARN